MSSAASEEAPPPQQEVGETKKKEEEEVVEVEKAREKDVTAERKSQCYEMFEKVADYLNGELAGKE